MEPAEPSPEDEADECCAICFEPGVFVDLPCSCAVKYCSFCWDRALASSVALRGRAHCPSCRSAFKVDYDTERGGLLLSRDPQGNASCDWRTQLYEKVRSVQINKLRGFGAAASRRTGPNRGCGCEVQPRCVCGAELEHISSRSRILRLLEDMEPGWRSRVAQADEMVERLLDSSLVTCDLCDQVAIRAKGVWTCKAGPHTVMHPAAYDVCESCFEAYSGMAMPLPGHVQKSAKLRSVFCWDRTRQTCSQACTAMLDALPRSWARRLQRSEAQT
mmetsp:Transcript_13453/g.31897  ORF Transcript_13453/g.31897 Transcript_13453/m.31897 type:complete len:274 (+) Transcript_13453:76-897(+)